MKLKSTPLGILILILFFGTIAASASVGWWQTGNTGKQNKAHGEEGSSETHEMSTLHGVITGYDDQEIRITTDDGQALYVQLGNSRYNQSIGFAPQIGERIKVIGFSDSDGLYNAVRVTANSTGITYTFRSETGQPLWSGGNGKGNGGGH